MFCWIPSLLDESIKTHSGNVVFHLLEVYCTNMHRAMAGLKPVVVAQSVFILLFVIIIIWYENILVVQNEAL